MKMITKEIENRMNRYPLYSQDGKGDQAKVLFKVFNPYGGQSWYVLEAGQVQPDGDRELFVFATYGGEGEYGYMMLSDFTNTHVKIGAYRMPLEHDKYFSGTMKDARIDAGLDG